MVLTVERDEYVKFPGISYCGKLDWWEVAICWWGGVVGKSSRHPFADAADVGGSGSGVCLFLCSSDKGRHNWNFDQHFFESHDTVSQHLCSRNNNYRRGGGMNDDDRPTDRPTGYLPANHFAPACLRAMTAPPPPLVQLNSNYSNVLSNP